MGSQKTTNKVTQVDLAKYSGVSQVTVHRALTGGCVSEATRQRILEASRKLGYQPNFFASQLRSKQRKVILLCIGYLNDPYYTEIAQVFESRARALGYRVIFTTSGPGGDSVEFHQDILGSNGVSNLVLIGEGTRQPFSDEVLDGLAENGITVLLIGRHSSNPKISQVRCDEAHVGYLVAQHFKKVGVRSSWVFSTKSGSTLGFPRQRAESFVSWMKKYGLPKPDVWEVPYGSDVDENCTAAAEKAREAIAQVERLPGGIFTATISLTIGVLRGLGGMGYIQGKDYRLVGHGDNWPVAHLYPAITTIRQPVFRMGTSGANLMVDVLEGNAAPGTVVEFKPELMVRET